MKSCFLVLAFISAVAAQAGLPQCAKDCVTKFTTGANIGGCPQIDAKCICSQQTFLSDIACCLADVCNAADQQAAVDFAVNFCSTQGVTVPNAVTCASAASTAASTASTGSSSSAGTASSTSSGTITSSSTATKSGTSSASSSTATSASKNIGNHGGVASGATGIVGGLLAALAFL